MHQTDRIKQASALLASVTPLRFDCGKGCDRACCRTGEEPAGMFLFPGEETLLKKEGDWLSLRPAGAVFPDLLLAECSGQCPREKRPLACRFFPLTPYKTVNGVITVKMDPRAVHICPLARESDKTGLQPAFVRATRKAAALLSEDPVLAEYIDQLSRMLDDYSSLPWYNLFIK